MKPVKRGGKTVGWDIFFHVTKPERHYYLKLAVRWAKKADTGYGSVVYPFHVKTR